MNFKVRYLFFIIKLINILLGPEGNPIEKIDQLLKQVDKKIKDVEK